VVEVRVVDAEVTLPLRQAVLRPHQTHDEVRAQGDGLPGVAVLDGERVLACASVREEPMPGDARPGDWRLRGMASDPAVRGQGYGALALTGALDYARDRGARRIWCNARTPAVGFYERHGFRAVGDEFSIEHAGPHYVMVLDLSTSGST
jgi:GNAT superfamily N-acetyltransferase